MIRSFICSTLVGRILFIPYRAIFVVGPYWIRHTLTVIWWLLTSKEFYNHSAKISKISEGYMANFISNLSGVSVAEVEGYFNELSKDNNLRQELTDLAIKNKRKHAGDVIPNYGRRIAWYALVRIFKPVLVVETGVDGGLGTAVICEALMRNTLEGKCGQLIATDNNKNCGYLIPERLKSRYSILLGDSIKQLDTINQPVDIFIHDSNHAAWYEYGEYATIAPRFHDKTLVISDNSKNCEVLRTYANNRSNKFAFFQEELLNHWWPGDGIGIMYNIVSNAHFKTL